MQAVILAGGKGTRMKHLVEVIPKPMIQIGGKNLLQYKIENLPDLIDEVILIVHYKKEVIMDFFGDSYAGKKITYVDQGEPLGTGHALFQAAPLIKGDFISMMGDDLYTRKNFEEIIKYPWAMTVFPHESFPDTGDVVVGEDGYMTHIAYDKGGVREGGKTNILLDVCLYKLNKDFFKTELVKLDGKNEYGLPHTLFKYLKETGTRIKVIQAEEWCKINSPEDVDIAHTVIDTFHPEQAAEVVAEPLTV